MLLHQNAASHRHVECASTPIVLRSAGYLVFQKEPNMHRAERTNHMYFTQVGVYLLSSLSNQELNKLVLVGQRVTECYSRKFKNDIILYKHSLQHIFAKCHAVTFTYCMCLSTFLAFTYLHLHWLSEIPASCLIILTHDSPGHIFSSFLLIWIFMSIVTRPHSIIVEIVWHGLHNPFTLLMSVSEPCTSLQYVFCCAWLVPVWPVWPVLWRKMSGHKKTKHDELREWRAAELKKNLYRRNMTWIFKVSEVETHAGMDPPPWNKYESNFQGKGNQEPTNNRRYDSMFSILIFTSCDKSTHYDLVAISAVYRSKYTRGGQGGRATPQLHNVLIVPHLV